MKEEAKTGAPTGENLASRVSGAFFDLDRSSGATSERCCWPLVWGWRGSTRGWRQEVDAGVFSELPGDGGSLRELGGQGRSRCKGKQSDVGIWGWRRGSLGGWRGLELELGGVWENGSSGPSPPALSGFPLDCDRLLRCSTLNVGKDIY